ncbi:MAG: ECF transporter S component, partial [Tissierellia bacterium]|nr:ECF transporter S component [Tissierellia bacterium]
MNISRKYISFTIIAFIILLLCSTFFSQKHYLSISLILLLITVSPFFIAFEKRELKAEEMVIISMLSAIGAIGRVPFAAIPSVQPTSFVIIMSGLSFGGNTGFMVGSTAALVSNMLLGQGPWTPWQMFAWGMMGFTASLFKNTKFMKGTIGRSIFGAIWGFLFGWIMNLWGVLYLDSSTLTWKVYLASCIASFKFDLNHAISNVVFI